MTIRQVYSDFVVDVSFAQWVFSRLSTAGERSLGWRHELVEVIVGGACRFCEGQLRLELCLQAFHVDASALLYERHRELLWVSH